MLRSERRGPTRVEREHCHGVRIANPKAKEKEALKGYHPCHKQIILKEEKKKKKKEKMKKEKGKKKEENKKKKSPQIGTFRDGSKT